MTLYLIATRGILHSITRISLNIIESGIINEKDAIELARFYWRIVDETTDDKSIEYYLEKLYTTFHIHFGNAGYLTIWDQEIP